MHGWFALVVKPNRFYDKAEFEAAKKRAGGIEKWIEEQLNGTSVTVVLFGAQTYEREWVQHEIKRSYELDKGILAIDIHNVKDPQHATDVQERIHSTTGRSTTCRCRSATTATIGFAITATPTCRLGSKRQRRLPGVKRT